MDVADHIAALAEDGTRLVAAAERAGVDAVVPTCPDWRVRDLLAHVGQVHRWATAFVAEARIEPPAGDGELATPPADADALPGWVADGHRALVTTLRSADPDVACWSFLPAPSPLAFWARRQAHETAMHRVDAESAAGAVAPVDPALAVDGIDELLLGFFARRRGRLVSDPPVRLGVRAADTGDEWSIEIRADGRSPQRGRAHGDCVVTGPASDLYLFLWNRREAAGLDVAGEVAVLDLWRAKAHVTWA